MDRQLFVLNDGLEPGPACRPLPIRPRKCAGSRGRYHSPIARPAPASEMIDDEYGHVVAAGRINAVIIAAGQTIKAVGDLRGVYWPP